MAGTLEVGVAGVLEDSSIADALTAGIVRSTLMLCLFQNAGLIATAAGLDDVGLVQPHNLQCVPTGQGEGECRFLPNIHRVNHRPDAVEVVLSETEPFPGVGPADADVFFTLLKDAGFCRIEPGSADYDPADAEPRACSFVEIFEVTPPDRDPSTICGEAVLRGPQ